MRVRKWEEFLERTSKCSCGKHHTCSVCEVVLEEQANKKIPELIQKYGCQKVCVVGDCHTWQAAGEEIFQNLSAHKISCFKLVLEQEHLVPDEKVLISLLTQIPADTELILGVGSGTINDLCKYMSHKMKTEYFIAATAPSMDGYASTGSPLIMDHLKITYETHAPKVIIGDLEVLANAPALMIAAGVGDMLGKYVCLADWQAAHLLQGEYLCEEIMKMVYQSVEQVLKNAKHAVRGEKEAVALVMEGLVLTGIAMSYVGNSRPASGSEHHLSHYWEMMFLLEGKPDPLHGIKVGIGTIAALRFYELLRERGEQLLSHPAPCFDFETWKAEIQEAYGSASEGVLALEKKAKKNEQRAVEKRRTKLQERQDTFFEIIEKLPKAQEIAGILKSIGAPVTLKEIGVSKEVFQRSVYYAKDLRNRFGLLQILYDLGLQEEFSSKVLEELYF